MAVHLHNAPTNPLPIAGVRRLCALVVLLAACRSGGDRGASASDETGGPPAADTADIVTEIDPAWVIGDEEPCTAPRDAPTWEDASGAVADYVGTDFGPKIGGVALIEVGADRWLLWGRPDAAPLARNLATGEEREFVPLQIAGAYAVADLDDDGALDVIATATPRILWDAFEDSADMTSYDGLDHHGPSDVGVADFDGDGDLDLLYAFQSYSEDDPSNSRPFLRLNEGGRAFSDPVYVGGTDDDWGEAFDINVLDVNDDGAPDAYLCHDMGGVVAPDLLLLNDGAGGLAAAEDLGAEGLDVAATCMGSTWGDPDSDGDLDALLSSTDKNTFLYQESGFFVDVSTAHGVEHTVAPRMPWGAAIVDDDNDGYPDVFVASSYFATVDEIPMDPWWYRQEPDGTFVDHASDLPALMQASSRGVVSQDVNGDGVVDLLIGGLRRSPWVYLSEGCTAASWVEVRGPAGSIVQVEAGGVTRAGLLTREAGWGSAAPPWVHFGLGEADVIDRIVIRPPWEAEVVLEGPIAARRRIAYAP